MTLLYVPCKVLVILVLLLCPLYRWEKLSVRDFQSKIPSFSDTHPHLPLHLILYHFPLTIQVKLALNLKNPQNLKKKKKKPSLFSPESFPTGFSWEPPPWLLQNWFLFFIICHLSEAILIHPQTDSPYPLVFLDPGLLFHVLVFSQLSVYLLVLRDHISVQHKLHESRNLVCDVHSWILGS